MENVLEVLSKAVFGLAIEGSQHLGVKLASSPGLGFAALPNVATSPPQIINTGHHKINKATPCFALRILALK